MREIVGFVLGAAAGAAGALFATSPEGHALIERLRDEARPEVERATTEWEPVLHEVGRAVRLAARELETATADLRSRIGEVAAAPAGGSGRTRRAGRGLPRTPTATSWTPRPTSSADAATDVAPVVDDPTPDA